MVSVQQTIFCLKILPKWCHFCPTFYVCSWYRTTLQCLSSYSCAITILYVWDISLPRGIYIRHVTYISWGRPVLETGWKICRGFDHQNTLVFFQGLGRWIRNARRASGLPIPDANNFSHCARGPHSDDARHFLPWWLDLIYSQWYFLLHVGVH